MKLLLHICCAPCLIFPLERLRLLRVDATGFFYNPNVDPDEEYRARRAALVSYAQGVSLDVIYCDDRHGGAQEPLHSLKRCAACWRQRLTLTARRAAADGFEAFSTTLLVSPYQDHARLRAIGEEAARETGVLFFYDDFRPGFRQARQTARSLHLYMQKYCGCDASRREREAVLNG
jgi:hypothetical protein